MQLAFNGGFHLSLALFQALVLFNTVLLVHGLYLALKAKVQFVANSGFLCGECVPFHGLKFGFHGGTEFVFQCVKRHVVLGGQVFGDVRLHGVDTLGDGLLP